MLYKAIFRHMVLTKLNPSRAQAPKHSFLIKSLSSGYTITKLKLPNVLFWLRAQAPMLVSEIKSKSMQI